MRLIDADALREDFARYTWGPYNPFARIDATPTVECAACEHWVPITEGSESRRCLQSQRRPYLKDVSPRRDNFVCSHFQRRQP